MDVRQCMIISNVAESAAESGLITEDKESILSKQYDCPLTHFPAGFERSHLECCRAPLALPSPCGNRFSG